MEMQRMEVPAHGAEHAFHGDQGVTMQSTGQLSVAQADVFAVAPHSRPPCMGWVSTALVCDAVPPSHVALQAPQLLQADMAQSTGQAPAPQFDSSCDVAGQLRPAPS